MRYRSAHVSAGNCTYESALTMHFGAVVVCDLPSDGDTRNERRDHFPGHFILKIVAPFAETCPIFFYVPGIPVRF